MIYRWWFGSCDSSCDSSLDSSRDSLCRSSRDSPCDSSRESSRNVHHAVSDFVLQQVARLIIFPILHNKLKSKHLSRNRDITDCNRRISPAETSAMYYVLTVIMSGLHTIEMDYLLKLIYASYFQFWVHSLMY